MRFVSPDAWASRQREMLHPRGDREAWMPDGEGAGLLVVVGFALAIRVYLSLTSYCISGDGVAYLVMARHFADGEWHAALGAVYSPLYPALISLMHPWVADWEMAGDLVSAILGTAAVATTYLMTRAAFASGELGLGAAVLMALHPQTASYSASVRTEAGYMFLTTSTCWLLFKALKEQSTLVAASSGMAAGLAYLYRTEAVGFLPLGIVLLLAAGWLWKLAPHRWVLSAAGAFTAVFVVVAAPYVVYLRIATGHWSVGREFTAAMMYGIGDVAQNGGEWRQLGWSANVSLFGAIFDHWRLYLDKVAQSFVVSGYNFAQALEPLPAVMLAIGIWTRARSVFARPRTPLKGSPQPGAPSASSARDTRLSRGRGFCHPDQGSKVQVEVNARTDRRVAMRLKEIGEESHLSEFFLAAVVLFYFCGFTFSYTGIRFMVHLIPFVFGWVTVGIIVVSQQAAQWCKPGSRRIVSAIVPAAIVLTLLPRTLWPNGYDMRGVRYAGQDIAQMTKGPAAVAARDGRVAYYAGARLIELPPLPPVDFCGWLNSQRGDFLMIGERDEHLFDVAGSRSCLELLKRYPRYGAGYFDLYAVRVPQQDGRSPSAAPIRP
jgi:Dolichyl-phosphate-mannose-protein mannosyltransferase